MEKIFSIQRWLLFILPSPFLIYGAFELIRMRMYDSDGFGSSIALVFFLIIGRLVILPLLLFGTLQFKLWNRYPVLAWNFHISALIFLMGVLYLSFSGWMLIAELILLLVACFIALYIRPGLSGRWTSWISLIVNLLIVVGLLFVYKNMWNL
ncbi:MAG: hypothetical protein HZA35_02240 [Parcubacteria group bacterium]|nr:hypothetical protein [Parcubacteria group bacterium]